MRPLLLTVLVTLAVGCDFTPTLDIELPPHERALFLSGVVAADSSIAISAGISRDPYVIREYGPPEAREDDVEVVLRRPGQSDVGLEERQCETFNYETGEPATTGCGVFETAVSLAPGETASFVARSPGLPDAVATVTLPLRPDASLGEVTTTERNLGNGETVTRYAFSLEVRDRAGADWYAIGAVSTQTYETCEDYNPTTGECERTGTQSIPQVLPFTTTDPLLVAASREIEDGGYFLIAFEDREFDGAPRRFRLNAEDYVYSFGGTQQPDDGTQPRAQLAALSPLLYQVRNIVRFSPGDDNPFAEVADLPSNVEGGYGLVGTVAIWEARLDGEDGP